MVIGNFSITFLRTEDLNVDRSDASLPLQTLESVVSEISGIFSVYCSMKSFLGTFSGSDET